MQFEMENGDMIEIRVKRKNKTRFNDYDTKVYANRLSICLDYCVDNDKAPEDYRNFANIISRGIYKHLSNQGYYDHRR